MRAIFIDAKNRKVSEIDHTGKLKDFYETIGCETVEVVPMRNDPPNDLWIDEEGRVNGTRFGFVMHNVPVFGPAEFFGNALIFTTDDEGDCAPPTLLLDDVRRRVRFWA